jgi:hypothetical protein
MYMGSISSALLDDSIFAFTTERLCYFEEPMTRSDPLSFTQSLETAEAFMREAWIRDSLEDTTTVPDLF